LSAVDALAVCRATRASSATACSAADTMFEVGALTTMTPRAVAPAMSTLSRPTPARATTRRRGRGGDGLRVDLGGAAHDDRVRVGQRGQQRRTVGAVDVADVEIVGEHLERGGCQFLGDQYDRAVSRKGHQSSNWRFQGNVRGGAWAKHARTMRDSYSAIVGGRRDRDAPEVRECAHRLSPYAWT
jgi:hypothetical protein